MIYFIADDVGRSRMSNFQVGNPKDLTFLFEVPGDVVLEEGVHLLFSDFHVRGEWFWYNKGSADLIRRFLGVCRSICSVADTRVSDYQKRVHAWISIQVGRRTEDDVMREIEECCVGWV